MKLSFEQITKLVREAVKAALGGNGYPYIVELYPDQVVYEVEATPPAAPATGYYQRTYAIVDGKVTLGEATAVQRRVEFVPLKAACSFVAATENSPAGLRWRVKVIEFGPDKAGSIFWDKAALTAALPMFEGAKVFALNASQHQDKRNRFGKSPRELVGALTAPTADDGAIYAEIVIMPSAHWLSEDLVACEQNQIPYVYGLSVDISAKAGTVAVGGKKMLYPQQIQAVQVDVVYDPAAGGGFLQQMAAAVSAGEQEDPMFKKLLAALAAKRPDLYAQIQAQMNNGTLGEEAAMTQIVAAMDGGQTVTAGEDLKASVAALVAAEMARQAPAGGQGQGTVANEALQATQLLACKLVLRDELGASKLPDPVQAKVRRRFEGQIFAPDQLQAAIKEEKEVLDQLTASGAVSGAGGVRLTVDSTEKAVQHLDDFFDGKTHSFKAAYIDITGDDRVSGQMSQAMRLTAALNSGSFALLLGDSITRRMIKEYNLAGLSDWRKIVEVVPLADFRTQRRARFGGYGDLPGVLEAGPYVPLVSPADEEATYAPSKRGGVETITLEMIKNDDVGSIRRIPTKLARAAARTLYRFVFNFMASNAVIYDAVALFNAAHANLLVAPLAGPALQAARLQMIQQQDMGANDFLGIPPKYLVVPAALEDTAYTLTVQPNAGAFVPTAPDAVRRQTWELIVNPYWVDANNWYLVADPKDIPTIEIGFLDGREDPELFLQDMPNVGSMFSNDQLTYKIRHIYGGAVVDYRGFQGNVVP